MTTTLAVQRIHTENGSHIEPPLSPAWTDLDKLRWHLAVALLDNGMPDDLIRVELSSAYPEVERYSLRWRNGGISAANFVRTWELITGIGLGMSFATKGVR